MRDAKKILYLANLNPNKFGSMEEHAFFLSRELQRRDHECYLGFISEPLPEIRRMFEGVGARILTVLCGKTSLQGSNTMLRFREMLGLYKMVVGNRIDLVHINFMGLTNPALLGLYLTRAKIVFTEHASGYPLQRGPLKHFITCCIHAVIARRVSKYIGVSNYVRDRFRLTHHVSQDKTITIYNGVNLERFCPRNQDDARKELGLPLGCSIISSVAMLIPEKGIQTLVKAASLLVNRDGLQDLLVLVVGEGYFKSDLEKLALELNIPSNIRFLGRRSDVETIIAASDIIVVPSVWEEAFGLIIAEAMASNRPVIASDIGGIPELIETGVNGSLIAVGNDKELATSILNILPNTELKSLYGSAGLLKAKEKFNLPNQVAALIDVYEAVLVDR